MVKMIHNNLVFCLSSKQSPPIIFLIMRKGGRFFIFLASEGGSNPAGPYPNSFPNPYQTYFFLELKETVYFLDFITEF